MNREAVDRIVNSVLYEGYMLYPYRRSSLKNKHRWNFGLVHPEGVEPNRMRTECLLQTTDDVNLTVEVRFLQLYERDSWQEAFERRITTSDTGSTTFQFDDIQGEVRIEREPVQKGLEKVRVDITNQTHAADPGNALLRCLVSTHTILSVRNGAFVSLMDPPEEFRTAAAKCENIGTWPVLAGKDPDRDCMLSSPIILYDYPHVADESPGDQYDGTEIDELLILRILTLSDSEKEEMRCSGERERLLLERAESLTPEQLLRLHGTMRDIRAIFKPGDRVRLRPKPGGDVFDVVLSGRIAIVESVEQDVDNRIHVAVVIEDDPGKDLGFLRQPGHRFFFSADEVERLP